MSQAKDSSPNGDYYPQPIHRARKRMCLLKATIAVIIGVGAVLLVFWLAVRPTNVKLYVLTADLTQFGLTNSNTLTYNLSLNMALRNPNKKVSIFYDRLDAMASYEGERFGWASLSPFYQGRKNTTDVRASFHGQQVMVLGVSKLSKFNQEKNSGVFTIDVKFNTRIRFKMGGLKTNHMKPDIDCHLRVPLASNGVSVRGGFESTKCDVDM